jgi:rhomboid protease GluP
VKLRSRVTIVLILINVAVFVFMQLHGGASQDNPYYLAGALFGPAVREGQWYRIVTGAFMHEGFPHIAINMFSLYQLGSFVETMLGGWRMLLVYAISRLAVVYFSPNDFTVGASGAIFGLFGALFAIGVRMGKPGRALISQTLPILVLNLVFTFAVPFISKSAHIGGLLSGFAAGLVIYAIRRRPVAATVTDAVTGESTEAELLPPTHDEAGAPQTHA